LLQQQHHSAFGKRGESIDDFPGTFIVETWVKSSGPVSRPIAHRREKLIANFITSSKYHKTMEMENTRMWVFYYLISFVALLWVGFLAVQGVMIFVSLFITLMVLGFSVILCVMLLMDMKNEKKSAAL
jgi:hypothetical protein